MEEIGRVQFRKKKEKIIFDIKTAKPNKGGFKEFKRTLLEWVAVSLAQNKEAKFNTLKTTTPSITAKENFTGNKFNTEMSEPFIE